MQALLFHYNPDLWMPSGRSPSAWPYSANAHKVHAATRKDTPLAIFNQSTGQAVYMGYVVQPINIAGRAGWRECDEDWEAVGWKTCPIPESSTFSSDGNWLPIRVHRVNFEMPEIALRERLDGKLYRRNPVVISSRAWNQVKEVAAS
jgi:hypothetical protein